MEKRGKSEFWRRREAFAREIERDTKEKSEQVAQRLAQAVRADEEKQAGRRAARGRAAGRAGGPARQPGAKAQAARTDGWGRSGPARTRAGAWDERESGPARTKISARGEAAGGAQSGGQDASAGSPGSRNQRAILSEVRVRKTRTRCTDGNPHSTVTQQHSRRAIRLGRAGRGGERMKRPQFNVSGGHPTARRDNPATRRRSRRGR